MNLEPTEAEKAAALSCNSPEKLEATRQFLEAMEAAIVPVEPSIWWFLWYLGITIFSFIGVVVSVIFVIRFIKNGFRLKPKPKVRIRPIMYVDTGLGAMFSALILSVIAVVIVRAMAAANSVAGW